MTNKITSLLKSKLGKDVVFTFSAQVLIMLTFLIVNKILSNSLGVDGYGQYSLIKKNSAVLSMVMLGGMGIALPRFFAFYRGKNQNTRSEYIALSSILFVIIVTLVVSILSVILYTSTESILIGTNDKLLYITTFIYSFSIAISAYMYAFYRGKNEFIKYNTTQIIIQLLILFSCFFIKENLIEILVTWSILTYLYTFYELGKSFRLLYKNLDKTDFILNIRSSLKEIFSYGLTRLLGDLVLFSFYALPLIYANTLFGMTQTSYFSVGITISNIITPLFALLGMILLPYVSEQAANENHTHIKSTVNKLMVVYLILSLMISSVLSVALPTFIELLFNKDYLASETVSLIIIWSIIAQSVYLLLRNPLDAVSKKPINTINLFVSLILMIGLFNYSESILDLAYSFLISNILLAILSAFSWYLIYPKTIKKN